MINRDKLKELDEACGRLAEAEEDVKRICREIADDPGTGTAEAGLAEARTVRKLRATGPKAPTAATGGRRGKPHLPKDPGQKDEPWRRVKCSECGTITGSRVVDGKRYPTGHYQPGTQIICPGRGKAAAEATKDEIAAAAAGDNES